LISPDTDLNPKYTYMYISGYTAYFY